MSAALETIAGNHRFNIASMRPHEVHQVVFNALEDAKKAQSRVMAEGATHALAMEAAAQAQSKEEAAKMGVSIGIDYANLTLAKAIRYPELWDTSAYPDALSAVAAMLYRPTGSNQRQG